jgi:predicted ArsR family transcriptional regulator
MLIGFRIHGMDDPGFDALPRLGALAEPVRRQLYRCVVAAPMPVSRDEAAEACGISRSLAAYHLDRLVEDELLEASWRSSTGGRRCNST